MAGVGSNSTGIQTVTELLQGIGIFAIAIAPVVLVLIATRRGKASRLDGAATLVLYGSLVVIVEHANFGFAEFGRANLLSHSGFHFHMLAAYGLVGLVLVGVVVAPLVRRGDKIGWCGLLTVLAIGFGAEVITAFSSTPHGVPPRYWIAGIFLWGYPVAWTTALVLSFPPIFKEDVGATPDGVLSGRGGDP